MGQHIPQVWEYRWFWGLVKLQRSLLLAPARPPAPVTRSSFSDRDELKNTVDRLEGRVDKFKHEYNENEMKEAHAELMRAMELASSVNRFMLRSEFGNAEDAWAAVRNDLNTLAAMHEFPAIQVYALRKSSKR